jgi:hypothetical protein
MEFTIQAAQVATILGLHSQHRQAAAASETFVVLKP